MSLRWLIRWQVERPALVLGIAGVITAVALVLAAGLRMLTGFEYLLPESRPSVVELRRVAAKTSGVSTLFVVLRGADGVDKEAIRRAGDELVKQIGALGPPTVGSVEDGVHEGYRFLGPRAGLFADVGKLEALRRDVDARYEYEVAKQTGSLLDDEPPPAIDRKRVETVFGLDGQADRYPDGYYQSADGRVLVIAIRSKVLASDFDKGTEAFRKIDDVVRRVRPASFDPSITFGYAGDLYSGLAEYRAIMKDLTEVGYAGAILIGGVVLLYYLRVRTLLVMLVTIGIGVAWTFGVTELAIGHLNIATGFLFTIVAGNGINSGILYMARYLEARRDGKTLAEGVETAHRETWVPTLTAALTASAAYGSLVITEFRGFRDFGMIGGYGMILCWVATYWTLPALLAASERVFPLESETGLLSRLRRAAHGGVQFGRPFAALVPRAPRLIAGAGLAAAVLGAVMLVFYVKADPMEYDLNHLRNDIQTQAEEKDNKRLADAITGYVGADGMAILVDRPDQVGPLRTALYAKRDAVPPDDKPFESLHALEDFVPDHQAEKIPVLLALRDRIVRAHKHGVIDEATWQKLERFLPPEDLRPFTMADLPDDVARTFTEADGTRGRIVYISPTARDSTEDAHYLLRWAASYRRTELPDGSVVLGSGRAVIYADMWEAIVEAVPRAVLFSFAATLLVVLVAFRGSRASWLVMGALVVGAAWLAGLLVLLGIKLNFLNFIALPITFGIGVDYAVNIVQRAEEERGPTRALIALRETGSAVILCSLTTTLGYLALVRSINFGVKSLGLAAVLGEVCCLLAAVLVLPAVLLLWKKRRAET